MRLLRNLIRACINKFIKHKSTGEVIYNFSTHMGLAYIKLAQILAMQNIGSLFTEKDRQDLLNICDNVNPVGFRKIKKKLRGVYGKNLRSIFRRIDRKPVGSASVSQVHRAQLRSGEWVVLKVRREKLINTVEKDLRFILFCVKHFGKLFGFYNYLGSEKALRFYEIWLRQEIDFEHEVKNIICYQNFADSVNGKVNGCVDIKLPKVYENLCNKDVIVMEYINYPTMKMKCDREKLLNGLDSYIKLSFYALFNGLPVVFHGDPHAGNIYIDDKGNVGFLDMGLVFELSAADARMTKEFFFCAYFGNSEKLYNMLIPYFSGSEKELEGFKEDIKRYCSSLHSRPLTAFFTDMMVVCFKYNIAPPDFLFGMAKAFVYLGGIDTIYLNSQTGHDLLAEQVLDYILRSIEANSKVFLDSSVALLKDSLSMERNTMNISKDIISCYRAFSDIFRYIL